jgi:hypothetical protein
MPPENLDLIGGDRSGNHCESDKGVIPIRNSLDADASDPDEGQFCALQIHARPSDCLHAMGSCFSAHRRSVLEERIGELWGRRDVRDRNPPIPDQSNSWGGVIPVLSVGARSIHAQSHCPSTSSGHTMGSSVVLPWFHEPHRSFPLQVRSGLHLLLSTLSLPRGSEVIVSALNIPDVPAILEHHGLVCVPVDLDLATLGIRADLLPGALSLRTRAILVAHVYGI